jgi:hypothetical protein
MAIHANRKAVLVPVAVLSAGILVASALGATAKVKVSDPAKTSVGPFGTVEINPPSIAARTCITEDESAPGLRADDHTVVQAPPDLDESLVGSPIIQPLPNLLTVRICNISNGDVNDGSRTWSYMVLR